MPCPQKCRRGFFGPQIEKALENGIIIPATPVIDGQVQPASIDLRLGARVWRIKASFLPGEGVSVADKLKTMAMHEIDLTRDAVLEKGCVYIAEVEESLNLPETTTGFAKTRAFDSGNDVFTRMITDGAIEFETAAPGYRGPIYAEISPRTFFDPCPTGLAAVTVAAAPRAPANLRY